MKLNTVKRNVESSGMGASVGHRIDLNAKSYDVLSNSMYSEIPSTIVRELSSNAYDSHVDAGKADVPFHVHCPTAFDPYLVIEDFGTGIRYYKFSGKMKNERDGESTLFIEGDVRKEIDGIDLITINEQDVVNMSGSPLFDANTNETVVRVAGNYSGTVTAEFDDTMVLTVTFFRSTKEESNDFIGAWGLGFKTPNAYVDNYMVQNRFNGTERTYNVYKNEEGLPHIRVMTSKPTDKCNGVRIEIAVDPDDFWEFKDGIRSQLRYFDPQPTIFNEEIDFPKLVHRGEHFMLYEDNIAPSGWRHANIAVGQCAYVAERVDSSLFNDGNLVIRFKIGELMVTASREDLRYNDDTHELIGNRAKQAIDEYRQYVLDQLELDTMKDYQKAAFLNGHANVLNLSEDRIKKAVGNPHYDYNARVIDIPISGWGDYVEVVWDTWTDDNGDTHTRVNSHKSYYRAATNWWKFDRRLGKAPSIGNHCDINPADNTVIFVKDKTYSFLKKIKWYIEENELDSDTRVYIVNLSNYTNPEVMTSIKSLVGEFVDIIYLSSIDLPKNANPVGYDYEPTPTARRTNVGDGSLFSPESWDAVRIPLTKIDTDAYLVATHRNELVNDYANVTFIRDYVKAGLPIDRDIKVVAVPVAKYDKALSYGFKPLNDFVNELKNNVTFPKQLVHAVEFRRIYARINNSDVMDIFNDLRTSVQDKLDADSPILKMYRLLDIWKKRYENLYKQESHYSSMYDRFEGEVEKPEPSEWVTKMVDFTKEVCDNLDKSMVLVRGRYSWNFRDKEESEALVEYTNYILRKEKGND